MARQSGRRMAKFDKKGRSISQHQAYTELIKQENKMRKFVSLISIHNFYRVTVLTIFINQLCNTKKLVCIFFNFCNLLSRH